MEKLTEAETLLNKWQPMQHEMMMIKNEANEA